MTLDSINIIVLQTFIATVIASYANPYLQYGSQYPTYVTSYPAQSYTPKPPPVYQPYVQPYPYPQQSKPAQTYSYQAPAPAPASPKRNDPAVVKDKSPQLLTPIIPPPKAPIPIPLPQEAPKLPTPDLPKTIPTFDSNILNNLAIALQLLIVSNLIHNPPPESKSGAEEEIPTIASLPIPYIPPDSSDPKPIHSNPYDSNHFSMPNANFLGTSSFGDTGISHSMMGAYGAPTVPKPRPSTLMSPYDAIASSTPYADASSSNKELRSPYHLTSDYNNLFALTELFKI